MLKKNILTSRNRIFFKFEHFHKYDITIVHIKLWDCGFSIKTRCTRGVRVVFSVTRMRSSNSARINKFDFRTEKSCSVHMTVFEIVAGHNVVNWMQLLT